MTEPGGSIGVEEARDEVAEVAGLQSGSVM